MVGFFFLCTELHCYYWALVALAFAEATAEAGRTLWGSYRYSTFFSRNVRSVTATLRRGFVAIAACNHLPSSLVAAKRVRRNSSLIDRRTSGS